MIWHHDPSQEPIAHEVEVQERLLDDTPSHGFTQQTASMSGIDPGFDPPQSFRIPPERWRSS